MTSRGGERPVKSERLMNAVREVLLRQWDPIGVSMSEEPFEIETDRMRAWLIGGD
jgi:hypothetical protein